MYEEDGMETLLCLYFRLLMILILIVVGLVDVKVVNVAVTEAVAAPDMDWVLLRR